MKPWQAILIGWLVMTAIMSALWLFQRRTGKAGIVDAVWSAGIGLLSIFFCVMAEGDPGRRILIAMLATAWSFRLGYYLFRRVMRLPEDGRYLTLKEQWGTRASLYMFVFFQIQATWSMIFALPMLVAATNPAAFPGVLDLAGVVMWVVAVVGESIADRQLARFRLESANRGKVCQTGLWRYSRHPNYFFEWLHWWVYVLIGISAPWGWLTLLGPATMLYFLFKVTGIPPTEAQAVISRGEAYRRYQQTTSAFFPWVPRKDILP